MNGSQHYQEGERLLSNASFIGADGPVQRDGSRFAPGEHCALVDRAMAHFAAAQVAATALAAVLPLVGGDSDEVTEWAGVIGALDKPAEPVQAKEPACWPPIAGDSWGIPEDTWGPYPVWFAQSAPGGVRLIPLNPGDDVLTPEQLLKVGEPKLLHRNQWEPPF